MTINLAIIHGLHFASQIYKGFTCLHNLVCFLSSERLCLMTVQQKTLLGALTALCNTYYTVVCVTDNKMHCVGWI